MFTQFSFFDFQVLISRVGNTDSMITLALIVILIFYVRGYTKEASVIALTSVAGISVIYDLKNLFKVARPETALMVEQSYRFPSGHAAMAAMLVSLIIIFARKFIHNVLALRFIYTLSVFWFLLICYSRLYLGVHLLIDVIVGGFIGIACTLVSVYILKYHKK